MITILVIEDDVAMHMAIGAVVPDWTLLSAMDGVVGLELLRQHQSAINLVVLDVAMPYLDGYETCLRIREIAPELPILPFTGLVDAQTLQFLDELHCAPPLIKPVDPALLETALRATVNTIPPPLAASAVRRRAQQTAAEREQAARHVRQAQIVVFAERWRDRETLKQLVAAAGFRVALEASHQGVLTQFLASAGSIGGSDQGFVVATTAAELPALTTFSREHDLGVLALAFTLPEALRLVGQVQAAGADWPPVGIVVDHPTNSAVVPPQIADAIRRLRSTPPALPSLLTAPFAATPLSPKEQDALALALHGLTSATIGAHTIASASTVRTHLYRIRVKLGLQSDEAALLRWAEAWWFEQLQRSVTGHDDALRERTMG